MIRVLLSSQGASSLMQQMIEAGVQIVLQQYTQREGGIVPIEVAAYHCVASSIALIQWWLEHNMPYPPERMGVIYQELIARPTSAVAF